MIKTIRVNNGSFANFGNVVMQPLASLVSQAIIGAQSTHPSQIGVLPTHQVPLSHPIMSLNLGNLTRFASPSLSEIGQHFITGNHLVIPLHGIQFTHIMPTYHLSLDSGKEYDPRLNHGFVTTATKFQPYEQLTGIAQERPEIVMVTNFEPLYNRDVIHTSPHFINAFYGMGIDPYMTDAGKFLDTQMQIRNLRSWNTQFFARTLRGRFANIDLLFRTRTDSLQNALNHLNVDASFLLNLVRIIEAQKAQLDLRHDIYTVDPNQVGSLANANYVQQQVSSRPNPLSQRKLIPLHLTFRHPPKYDFVDTLTSMGYKEASVQSVYSSSKVWMQTLLELSYALKFHTLQFLDIDPSYQRNDTNPTTILNPKVTRFTLSTTLPSLPPLAELISLQPSLAAQAITTIKPAFSTIYQNVLFKDEEARIAALAHLLSMEYRYSFGLTQPSTVRALSDFYGYTVQAGVGNTTMFDNIIGKFGNNITDFPAQSTKALTSVAQQANGATGVLTFENKYVEGDTGTLSPGGDFYFDQVLQTTGKSFNTTNIDTLTGVIDSSLSSFNIIIDNMNLLARPNIDTRKLDGIQETEGSILDTTSDLLNAVKSSLVDANGNTSRMLQNDRLASVFAFARKDSGTKAALFLYVMAKVSRAYNSTVPFFTSNQSADNTPLVDTLIAQVNAALQTALPHSRAAVQLLGERGFDRFQVNNSSALNPQGVATALKAGTPLTNFIITLMGQIVSQFRARTQAIRGDHTQYSGYLDTIVMMVAFDLITSAIARYGSLNLTGVTSSGVNLFFQGTTSYVVSQTTTNHRNSVNELVERALGEDTRVQRLILTVLNALHVLSGSLKGISNYLKSPTSIARLQEIAAILGNDQQLISMLFSEQQIMLLASTVSNLLTAANQGLSPYQKNERDTNDNQEIQILDESDVPEAMRHAIYGYFGTADFASAKGINKRILTVGIPQGFTQRIKQKVNIRQQSRASFQNKRNDLVQVCVYKVDMVNSDIVYKPKRFLFEMSRFPVRVSTAPWLPLPARPSTQDIVNSVPTLNFSQNADVSTSKSITQGIEYASAVVAGNDGIKNARTAMDGDEYSFLNANQKAEILQNHVASQIAEAYVKLMTGINVAEYTFDMANVPPPLDVDFLRTITEHSVAHISQLVQAKASAPAFNLQNILAPVGGLMFSTTAIDPPVAPQGSLHPLALAQPQLSNPAGIAGFSSLSSQLRTLAPATNVIKTLDQMQIVGHLQENLASITPRYVPLAMENFRTISGFSYTLSSASDPDALNQKVVVPKQFDRVFNVIVDPTDFEVDISMTTTTPYGREALNLMIRNGELVPLTENAQASFRLLPFSPTPITAGSRFFIPGRPTLHPPSFRYRDRDVSQGDLIADKYFITIETFDEGT